MHQRLLSPFSGWFGDGVRAGLGAAETVVERFALAEVDAALHEKTEGLALPALAVIALLWGAETGGRLLLDVEGTRLAVTSIALGAAAWSAVAMVRGLRAAAPWAASWARSRLGLRGFVRLCLYDRILGELRGLLAEPNGGTTTLGSWTLAASAASGGPATVEALAFRLADRASRQVVSHLASRAASVSLPILAAWTYYRFALYPRLLLEGSGMGPLAALLYPPACLADALLGTHLHAALSG